nr:pilus assembly protein N-terminal domain-containing protein [Novosphingobium panipatense]
MKHLIAASLLLAGTALSAPPAMAQTSPRAAEQQELLQVDDMRTLSFPGAIGRVEVSRENVIGITAPTTQSIRIKALAVGDAVLTVFAKDGTVMAERTVRVGGSGFTGQAAAYRPGEKVVAVDVQFAAVSSSTLKALGFSFAKLAGDLQGAVISPSGVNSYSNGPTGLSIDAAVPIQSAFNLFLSARKQGIGAVLSALSSNGLSQLLAQPTLLVRSGEQASFLAGGEFPVPVPQNTGGNGNTLSIEYKEFGVRLSVTPYVLSSDHIVLKLAPEVSELDYNNGVQLQGYVVPGIRRRSAETTVELGSGQSFVIAGLNYTNSAITKDKVPFLGDIPVLGAFFKRQQNQKERQELIIVATPRLVEPGTTPVALPSPPGNPDPSLGQMIVGNDGVEQSVKTFGVVRP